MHLKGIFDLQYYNHTDAGKMSGSGEEIFCGKCLLGATHKEFTCLAMTKLLFNPSPSFKCNVTRDGHIPVHPIAIESGQIK